MKCVTRILNKFYSMFGEEVSQEKIRLFFSKNVSRSRREQLVQMLGFIETNSLGKYLGVAFIGNAPRRRDNQYIIDQVNSKLAMWKGNQLAFAGRITVVKSVIKAFPIYPMMTTIIPKACINEINEVQRRFIWG